MGNMAICELSFIRCRIVKANVLIGSIYFIFGSGTSSALDWRFTPMLSASEIFSDNLNLSENDKKSGFVSEVSPGLSLFGSSPWSSFNLNYRMQGLYNAGGREALDVNNQLNMNSVYQAVRNRLFIETASSISQQNISNSFITTDNISGNGHRTEAKTFSISPYWTPQFGQYANGYAKVGYNRASFDNLNGPVVSPFIDQISDSEMFSRQARLSSGSYFNRINWGLNYSSQEQTRANGQDVRFEQYQGDVRYFFSQKYSVFGLAGFENNDYQSVNAVRNGFFYTAGATWNPNRWLSFEAGYGNNKRVSVRFSPSGNFDSSVSYQHRSVGLNVGSSWNADLHYRIQQASLGFNYNQETTTYQQLLVEQGFFKRDSFGNLTQITPQDRILLDQSGRAYVQSGATLTPLLLNPFNQLNDVIISKRGTLSFNYQTGKSNYNASVFNERRSYELRSGEDMSYGISGGWQWQFEPRLSFYLQPTWMHTDGLLTTSTRYDVSLGVTRGVLVNLGRPLIMNTRLELRHINQSTDNSQFGGGYIENRATANLNVQF